jgi:hypothetical protein
MVEPNGQDTVANEAKNLGATWIVLDRQVFCNRSHKLMTKLLFTDLLFYWVSCFVSPSFLGGILEICFWKIHKMG